MSKNCRRIDPMLVEVDVTGCRLQLTFIQGNKSFVVESQNDATWLANRLTQAVGQYAAELQRHKVSIKEFLTDALAK